MDSMHNFKGQCQFYSVLPEGLFFSDFRGFAVVREQQYCIILLLNSAWDEWDGKGIMTRIYKIKIIFVIVSAISDIH